MPKRSTLDANGPRSSFVRIAAIVAIATIVVVFMPQTASAAERDFHPGYIIRAARFFDGPPMSQHQTQTF
jgi:hypothetical protein